MLLVYLILKLKLKYAVQKRIRGERTGYYPEVWTQFKCLRNFYLKLLFVKLLKKLFERKSALSNHWQFFLSSRYFSVLDQFFIQLLNGTLILMSSLLSKLGASLSHAKDFG